MIMNNIYKSTVIALGLIIFSKYNSLTGLDDESSIHNMQHINALCFRFFVTDYYSYEQNIQKRGLKI